jgi:hypothetical protein
MPLEIKDIVVSVTVTEDFLDQSEANTTLNSDAVKEDIIAECVEQILELIKEKNEP